MVVGSINVGMHCDFVSSTGQHTAKWSSGLTKRIKWKTKESILHLSVATLLPFRLKAGGIGSVGCLTPSTFYLSDCFAFSSFENEIFALIPIAAFD